MHNAHLFESVVYTLGYLDSRPAHLQRAKGHFIEDSRVEQLNIGVLENESHATPEGQKETVIPESFRREWLAAKTDRTGIRKTERVEQSKQGRLSGAISADQRRDCPRSIVSDKSRNAGICSYVKLTC